MGNNRCFSKAVMRVSYNRWWKLLIDKKMKKIELLDQAKISSSTLALMGQDRKVSMTVLMKICAALKCNIGDIMDILPDEPSLDSEVR